MAVSEPILPKAWAAFLRTYPSESSKALSNRGMAVSEPILPKASAVFLRTSLSESSKALSNPGMAVSEPILPKAYAALQRTPQSESFKAWFNSLTTSLDFVNPNNSTLNRFGTSNPSTNPTVCF